MERYSALQANVENLKTSHVKEIITAFACGGMSLFAALGVYRVASRVRLAARGGAGTLDVTLTSQ
jgi:hypothetical protein